MGFMFSKKGSIVSDYFLSAENQSVFKKGETCDVAVYDDHIEIEGALSKKKAVLQLARVTDAYYGVETEIVSKNKSVIGRAVAGGILFGGVGALVGAASGTQQKQVKKRKNVFVISYVSADGDDAFLQFEDVRCYKGAKVYREISRRLKQPEEQDVGEIVL